jgi:hypothetical protein
MSSSLSHSQADVVRWLLIAQSIGTDPASSAAWPIYVSNEPDTPDNLITIYDTAGIFDGRIQRSGEKVEYRGIMIQVRGTSHPVAWAKTDALRVALDEAVNKTIVDVGDNQYIVYSISRQSGPIALGREPSTSRFLFSINCAVILRQLS